MMSEREPASEEAMEINYLELEQRMVEQRIEAAQGAGGEALRDIAAPTSGSRRADSPPRRRGAVAYEHMFASSAGPAPDDVGMRRDELETHIDKGCTLREMADQFELSISTVRYWLDK